MGSGIWDTGTFRALRSMVFEKSWEILSENEYQVGNVNGSTVRILFLGLSVIHMCLFSQRKVSTWTYYRTWKLGLGVMKPRNLQTSVSEPQFPFLLSSYLFYYRVIGLWVLCQ